MSDEQNKPKPVQDDQPANQSPQSPPDGRGERPTDPNELARWIVDQSTGNDDDQVS